MSKANSALGKRSRAEEYLANGKSAKSPRTSVSAPTSQPRRLRDRSALSAASSPIKTAPVSQVSRRQISVIVPTTYGAIASQSADASQVISKRRKTWLSQGLYAGQSNGVGAKAPGYQRRKKAVETCAQTTRTMLPLPMFGFLDQERGFRLPWDVYSPLPKGQPKPDEWKKTRSNQFVGDAKEEWKIHKHLAASACMCTTAIGCDEQCLNRIMKYECDDNNCAIGPDHCVNRRFAELKERVKSGKKYNIGVEVVSTEGKGFGVRAARTFEPGQIIVEYSGEIITQDECHRRLNEEYKTSKAYYLMAFDQNMIIDATKGSIARFINHSCNPNCTMEQWVVHGRPRMALFAGEQGIVTGEELTYDYNYDSFSKKVQKCLCNAPNCRGILGPKPPKEKERKIIDALEGITSGLKRKATSLLTGKALSGNTSTKRRRVSAPVAKNTKSSTSATIRKRRVTVGEASRTAADKENALPRSLSSSRSGSATSSVDFVRRPSHAGLQNSKRASGSQLHKLIPESFKPKGTSTIKRTKTTPESVKGMAEKLDKQHTRTRPRNTSASAQKPGSEEKLWNTFGKNGRGGKWRYEVVPVSDHLV